MVVAAGVSIAWHYTQRVLFRSSSLALLTVYREIFISALVIQAMSILFLLLLFLAGDCFSLPNYDAFGIAKRRWGPKVTSLS